MEINKDISKEGVKWSCSYHPSYPCDFINLDGDAKDRVICFRCIQINQIPVSNLVQIGCVLASKENDILETYPPLKDSGLSEKLRHVSLQQSLEEIELYFKKLRENFEKEVEAAQQRAKQILIKQEQARWQVQEEYIRIAEIDKLKELIVSNKEGAKKDLDGFIKDKWNKAEENRKNMLDLMSQAGQDFSCDEPNRITQNIIDSLKNINFFEQPIQSQSQEVNLIKSTYGHSQYLAIKKLDNSIYQIEGGSGTYWGQVYLDPILNPLKKYIIEIELEMKPGNTSNYFIAGIVKDEGKDSGYAYSQDMCYYDFSNSHGITKCIKGNPMQSGSKATGKHSLEFRVHLDQQLLRVASLPDYSSILELDDPNKINPKVNYRFFFGILNQGNMLRINKVCVVDKFDGKM